MVWAVMNASTATVVPPRLLLDLLGARCGEHSVGSTAWEQRVEHTALRLWAVEKGCSYCCGLLPNWLLPGALEPKLTPDQVTLARGSGEAWGEPQSNLQSSACSPVAHWEWGSGLNKSTCSKIWKGAALRLGL
jgi:hypothetical protein